jgi:ABC-type cobalamin/Fe3+-siderophores transport system ATPase subunit
MTKFNFPIIKKIKIQNFSLYKKADFLDIDLDKNVFCLAGANGLGKSTFITIINYALTGIVKNPNRKFSQYNEISKFYNQSKGFTSTYFDGRITEDDIELAEVTVEFKIGNFQYTITRGFFEPDELRYFSKQSDNESLECDGLSFSEINDLYKLNFTKDVNLSQFDQFVFLQSYLFTFDETHQLLFWDESLMERVLYLFFGVDSNKAKAADKLRKEYNKSDSDARNLQWQITKTRNELNSIKKKMLALDVNDTDNIELVELHKSLLEEYEEVDNGVSRVRDEIKDCDLNISDLSLRASSLRSEYEFIFNQSLKEEVSIEKNPAIIDILNQLKVRIYSSKDFSDLIDKLVAEIKLEQGKSISVKTNEQYFNELRKIDESLYVISNNINTFQGKKDRLIERENHLVLTLNQIGLKIEEIERDNLETIRSINNLKNNNQIDAVIKTYEDAISQYSRQKDDSYEKRNNARKELDILELELNQGFIEAESRFIPIFNNYAKSFLGLNITIGLTNSVKGASLYLDIEDSKRKDSYQLSESQRYFIDIALRMALIELSTNSATFLIDTPEGSLDIAYESRAGKMLGDFAKTNHKLIMTANINSSQLLLELANICRAENMKIERMTNWTTLSDVQQQESQRIEDAYNNIESTLNHLEDEV